MDAKGKNPFFRTGFKKDLQNIEDLRKLDIDQLQYIAMQQIARHRLYSFAQGGLAGTGGTLLLVQTYRQWL